jgi:hypothetical protein
LKVLEKIAGYAQQDPGVVPEDKEACKRLVPEYYVLRTALVSKIIVSNPYFADIRCSHGTVIS